jgi:hypothetical protein
MRCVSLVATALVMMAGLTPVAASADVVPAPCIRTVSINDVTEYEGDPQPHGQPTRPNAFTFTVSTGGCPRASGVMYSVLSTDTEPEDHSRPSGVLEWEMGETAPKKINIYVHRDNKQERNEEFTLKACPGTGVVVERSGVGKIVNDDSFTLPGSPLWPNYHCPQ